MYSVVFVYMLVNIRNFVIVIVVDLGLLVISYGWVLVFFGMFLILEIYLVWFCCFKYYRVIMILIYSIGVKMLWEL